MTINLYIFTVEVPVIVLLRSVRRRCVVDSAPSVGNWLGICGMAGTTAVCAYPSFIVLSEHSTRTETNSGFAVGFFSSFSFFPLNIFVKRFEPIHVKSVDMGIRCIIIQLYIASITVF